MGLALSEALVGVGRPRRLHDLIQVGLIKSNLYELRYESRLTSYRAEAELSRTGNGAAKCMAFPIPGALVGVVRPRRLHDLSWSA